MTKFMMRRDLLYFIAIVLIFVLGLCSMSFALAAEVELSAVDGIQLYLTDSVTGAPLSKAALSVHRRGTDEKYVLETDEGGRCATRPLAPGSVYDIIETAAPEGYILPMQGWIITVAEDGAVSAKGRNFAAVNESGALILNILNTSVGDGSELKRDVGDDEIPLSAPVVIGSSLDNTFMMVLGTCMMLSAVVWLVVILSKRVRDKKGYGVNS